MDFLWCELRERQSSEIELQIVASVYGQDIERSFGELYDLRHIFVRRDRPEADAHLVGVRVRDPEPAPDIADESEPEPEDLPTASNEPQEVATGSAAFHRRVIQLLIWIVALLALIGFLVLWKPNSDCFFALSENSKCGSDGQAGVRELGSITVTSRHPP